MKRKWIIGVTVFTLLMTGCQPKANNEEHNIEPAEAQGVISEIDQESVGKTIENTNNADNMENTENVEASTIDLAREKEALVALLQEGRMAEYKMVLPNYINDFDQSEIDSLFLTHYTYLEEHLAAEIDLYYKDDMSGMYVEITNALSDQAHYNVYGNDKLQLVDKMQTESYKALVQKTLESGYALSFGEGSYYPQLDYLELLSMYEDKLSDPYTQFLVIMSDELKQPLMMGEYLAVDLDTLKTKMYAYETYLQNFGKQIKSAQPAMFETIRSQFSVSIWHVVNPSLFNGLLGMDYYPTQELVDFYQSIVKEDQYPITTEAVSRILKVIEEKREDVFGSEEKIELLFPLSQAIVDDLNQKIEMMY
ncbi:hypothetical protein [Fusibacter ferrireducens]|uniref:Lipoprotein n=1 Tax=Fusibacter ferrireducens TaxID=2785058 RepID=A0ABR9ZSZ4_9FIRM|nr:hypothetical protein [Fusibacter ferrireducens]MBF4693598.1 hypothetical protein [Fusibacter ferrireducens]